MKRGGSRNRGGFSLVEVTLALALVTFCLIALVGLLPAGLDSIKESNNESAAVNCMEQIAESIRHADPDMTTPEKYKAAGSYKDLSWTLAGTEASTNLENLSASGFPGSATEAQRFSARVKIIPPSSLLSCGTALIEVAWPGQSKWDETSSSWKNSQGSVKSCVVFLPKS